MFISRTSELTWEIKDSRKSSPDLEGPYFAERDDDEKSVAEEREGNEERIIGVKANKVDVKKAGKEKYTNDKIDEINDEKANAGIDAKETDEEEHSEEAIEKADIEW